MTAQHGTAQIHLMTVPPIGWIILPELPNWTFYACVVDEQIDGPEFLFDLLNHSLHTPRISHICRYREYASLALSHRLL